MKGTTMQKFYKVLAIFGLTIFAMTGATAAAPTVSASPTSANREVKNLDGTKATSADGTTALAAATGIIVNDSGSATYITVDSSCYNWQLGADYHRVYPGSYSQKYNRGFSVPKGWVYSSFRNGATYRSGAKSGGGAQCTNGSDTWHVLIHYYAG